MKWITILAALAQLVMEYIRRKEKADVREKILEEQKADNQERINAAEAIRNSTDKPDLRLLVDPKERTDR